MNMVSLKRAKKPKDGKSDAPCCLGSSDLYPWGTRITFDDETCNKLGLDPSALKVGSKVKIVATAEIVEVSSRKALKDGAGSGKTETTDRVEVQMTDLAFDPDNSAEMAEEFKSDKD